MRAAPNERGGEAKPSEAGTARHRAIEARPTPGDPVLRACCKEAEE